MAWLVQHLSITHPMRTRGDLGNWFQSLSKLCVWEGCKCRQDNACVSICVSCVYVIVITVDFLTRGSPQLILCISCTAHVWPKSTICMFGRVNNVLFVWLKLGWEYLFRSPNSFRFSFLPNCIPCTCRTSDLETNPLIFKSTRSQTEIPRF